MRAVDLGPSCFVCAIWKSHQNHANSVLSYTINAFCIATIHEEKLRSTWVINDQVDIPCISIYHPNTMETLSAHDYHVEVANDK
jgi:hypothetical protein